MTISFLNMTIFFDESIEASWPLLIGHSSYLNEEKVYLRLSFVIGF